MNAPSARPAKLPHLLDGPAQYERGVDHLLGRSGVTPDLGIAVTCFLNAAACDDARGLYSAGMLYLRGIGVMANPRLATSLLQAAAKQQHPPAVRALQAIHQRGDAADFPIVPPAVAEPATAWATSSRLWGRAWKLLRAANGPAQPSLRPLPGSRRPAR